MAIFNNSTAVKLDGIHDAKFLGFKAVPMKEGDPLIKAIFELQTGSKPKVDFLIGSKVDLVKLNQVITAVGKPAVDHISKIDLPVEGGIIPADWDKLFKVEVYYPLKNNVPSNFASVKAVIGSVPQGVTTTPQTQSVPML